VTTETDHGCLFPDGCLLLSADILTCSGQVGVNIVDDIHGGVGDKDFSATFLNDKDSYKEASDEGEIEVVYTNSIRALCFTRASLASSKRHSIRPSGRNFAGCRPASINTVYSGVLGGQHAPKISNQLSFIGFDLASSPLKSENVALLWMHVYNRGISQKSRDLVIDQALAGPAAALCSFTWCTGIYRACFAKKDQCQCSRRSLWQMPYKQHRGVVMRRDRLVRSDPEQYFYELAPGEYGNKLRKVWNDVAIVLRGRGSHVLLQNLTLLRVVKRQPTFQDVDAKIPRRRPENLGSSAPNQHHCLRQPRASMFFLSY
jgi:hypothetical protein